ncbi:MAG TPA: amidohydrolase family protein [Actinomycetes bacterium]|nr:amidohydrolase family protein [Actinomycetes bacterium]
MPDDFDLVIGNASLRAPRHSGDLHWIGIVGGTIAAISDSPIDGTVVLDAGGGLVTESFVNAHMHLDKVYTLDLVGDDAISAYRGGGMGGALSAIDIASAVKDSYDESWIEPNARAAILQAIRHGVRHILAFADVDSKARLAGIRPLLRLREEFRGVVDLQVVAFPQDGLLRDDGTEDLVREAVALGADVVGGIPWLETTDTDAREHARRMCALAAETGRRVAMLVDDAGDPSLRTTQMLAEELIAHDLVGRGIANHARAMGLYPQPSLLRLIELARRAGLGFVSDPHTGPLHLPVEQLVGAGLPVALGQDDIEDAYYPYGQHNMLEVAFLSAHILGLLDAAGTALVLDLVTTRAADVLGVDGHRLVVGGNADLVVHEDASARRVLARQDPPRYVIASGRMIAANSTTTTWHLPT